jgi:hypothetical protein
LYIKNLRKHARRSLCFEVEITTNTLAVVQLEPAHVELINRIRTLAESGLTNAQVAHELNRQGVKSHSGRDFYAQLVGALVSKYRRSEKDKWVEKIVKIFQKKA